MKLNDLKYKNITDVYPSERIKFHEQAKRWIDDYQKTFLGNITQTLINKETLDKEMDRISRNSYCFSGDVLSAYDEFMKQTYLYTIYRGRDDKDKVQETRLQIIKCYSDFEEKINNRINILYTKQAILFIIVLAVLFLKFNVNINL